MCIVNILNGRIIGIEHFEFDSFTKTRKGSKFKRENAETQRELNVKIIEQLSAGAKTAQTHGIISAQQSLGSYIANLSDIFNAHAQKIAAYKENIRKSQSNKNRKIGIWFFIEDTTQLGNHCYDKEADECGVINPFLFEEVIDLLEREKDSLKGVIFGNEYLGTMRVVYNTKQVREKLKKDTRHFTEDDFQLITQNVVAFTAIIPDESTDNATV